MDWLLPGLISDVIFAWNADNWPYTLAFWAVFVIAVFFLARHARRRGAGD
jgi:hypothetical protein